MDHEARGRIADDVLKFGDGKAGVQRQEHRAEPAAGELHLQRIGRVQRQHRDPVAARDSEPVPQMGGEPRNARVELRVGEVAPAGEVDNRRFIRRAAAEMGDPVVISNRQNLLPRSPVLRRLVLAIYAISASGAMLPRTACCAPLPREAVGSRRAKLALRGRGGGCAVYTEAAVPADRPPPPTPPRHAQGAWREGRSMCRGVAISRRDLPEVCRKRLELRF